MWHIHYSTNIEGLLYARHCVNGKTGNVGRDQTIQGQVKFCLYLKSKWKSLNDSRKRCNMIRWHVESPFHCSTEERLEGTGIATGRADGRLSVSR